MKYIGGSSTLTLILFLMVGAIFGGVIGEILVSANFSSIFPYLVKTYNVFSIQNVHVNLYVISFNFGITFSPNLISLLGLLLAAYLFRRL